MGVIDVLLIIVSVLLITLVVIQNSKDDAANAFSGEKSDLFSNKKERGFELVLSRTTLTMSILFILLAIWSMTV
jgi:preprotein translocase subunit SecG